MGAYTVPDRRCAASGMTTPTSERANVPVPFRGAARYLRAVSVSTLSSSAGLTGAEPWLALPAALAVPPGAGAICDDEGARKIGRGAAEGAFTTGPVLVAHASLTAPSQCPRQARSCSESTPSATAASISTPFAVSILWCPIRAFRVTRSPRSSRKSGPMFQRDSWWGWKPRSCRTPRAVPVPLAAADA